MLVRTLRDIFYDGTSYEPGAVVEIADDSIARRLIKEKGVAPHVPTPEPVKAEPVKAKPAAK